MSNRSLFLARAGAGLLVYTCLSIGCGSGDRPKGIVGPTQLIVTNVVPHSGPVDAAAEIRVFGKGFQPGASVTLGGAATNVKVVSDTLITATAPIHVAAVVDVVVTNPGGEVATLPGAYRYEVPTPSPLVSFTEPGSGFSTTNLRDAQDQILQLNAASELIWTADGTRLPGYHTESHTGATFVTGRICAQGCAFEIRFGTKDGERRAYLTVDYGHDNPGTLVDVEVVGGALVVTQTSLYAPGTFELSGRVTEMTAAGEIPVQGAFVHRAVATGWRTATTDQNGFYSLLGMFDSLDDVVMAKAGYQEVNQSVAIRGDTRFDVRMVRVLPPRGLQ